MNLFVKIRGHPFVGIMLFHYKILNKEGKTVKGTTEAKDKFALYHALKQDGSTVIYAEEVKEKLSGRFFYTFHFYGSSRRGIRQSFFSFAKCRPANGKVVPAKQKNQRSPNVPDHHYFPDDCHRGFDDGLYGADIDRNFRRTWHQTSAIHSGYHRHQ